MRFLPDTYPLVRMTRFALALLLGLGLALTLSTGALADTLGEAKQAGHVGERRDGYLEVLSNEAPSSLRALVEKINGERRNEYKGIATQNKLALDQVEALAGKRLAERAKPGDKIQRPDGKWVEK